MLACSAQLSFGVCMQISVLNSTCGTQFCCKRLCACELVSEQVAVQSPKDQMRSGASFSPRLFAAFVVWMFVSFRLLHVSIVCERFVLSLLQQNPEDFAVCVCACVCVFRFCTKTKRFLVLAAVHTVCRPDHHTSQIAKYFAVGGFSTGVPQTHFVVGTLHGEGGNLEQRGLGPAVGREKYFFLCEVAQKWWWNLHS